MRITRCQTAPPRICANQSERILCEGFSRKPPFPRQKSYFRPFPRTRPSRNRAFSGSKPHIFLSGSESFLLVFSLNQKEHRLREPALHRTGTSPPAKTRQDRK